MSQDVIKVAVFGLLGVLVLSIAGLIYLAANQTPAPDVLTQIPTAVVAGLLGLLVQKEQQ